MIIAHRVVLEKRAVKRVCVIIIITITITDCSVVVCCRWQGHCTGYSFHDALVRRSDKPDQRVNAEVELPPTLTAVALHDDEWYVAHTIPINQSPITYF